MPGSFLSRWLQPGWERLTVGEYSGIAFADTSRAKHARQAFITCTTAALDLIRRVDPRRFRRIRAQLQYIVHQELPHALGRYDKQFRACYVDFTRLDFSEHPEITTWAYAAVLVHEATHGRIHGFGIPYCRKTRERIEHLCDAESARFLRRCSDQAADSWNEIMNRPGRRAAIWAKTPWQRMVALWKRRHATGRTTDPPCGADGRQPFGSRHARTSSAAASRGSS